MRLTIFASGSGGNCALVSEGNTHLLLDAGVSARRIAAALAHCGLTLDDLSGCLITHTHSDHIAGLATLTKRHATPLYATAPAGRQLAYRLPVDHLLHTLTPTEDRAIGGITVRPIPTSHDAPGSAGYRFTAPDGRSACLVTDLGVVTKDVEAGIQGVHAAVIECNHDPNRLQNGPYPYYLKARIAGPEGHLSNEDGARLCALAAQGGAHTVVLAHLSKENNSPALARAAVAKALAGFEGVRLEVAPVLCDGLFIEV